MSLQSITSPVPVLLAACVLSVAISGAQESFNVNLYAYGRQLAGDVWLQETARQTVRLNPGDVAGAPGFATSGWQNVLASIGSSTITSSLGSTATFSLLDQRAASPYLWTSTRNSATFGSPNATLLDGKSHGTFDPGDATVHSIFQVTNIPFAAYDVAIYLGINQAQSYDGKGRIRINGGAEQKFTMFTTGPTDTLVECTDDTTVGNYLVYRGLSGPSLHVEIRGDGFTHLGPAGFQILKAARAREPLALTDFAFNRQNNQVTLTWKSFPGDKYGIYWSPDMQDFAPIIHPAVPAHASDIVTTFGPFTDPVPGAAKGFYQIGPPDLKAPTLNRTWGNNQTISLTFSEPMAAAVALDPANYVVTKNGGGNWSVQAAAFHPGHDTVVLTTTAPLDPDAIYTVTMSDLTDRAGRALEGGNTANFRTWDNNPNGVKVYVLSGQSNMVGRGSVEKGVGNVNGAIGSLRYQAVNDTINYGHLLADIAQPATSAWAFRSDVKLFWNKADIGGVATITKGNLGPQVQTNTSFGPEYGFGWAVGDHHTQPVLLIKACWGGKSLYYDFRSPRAVAARGGEIGGYYLELIEQVRECLDSFATNFPEWNGLGYQIAGFGWHQGWNDILSASSANEYEANLVDLIHDLRAEFGQANLPVSIGATGQGGSPSGTIQTTVINAQLAVANPALHPEFAGTVFTRDTRPFWRASTVSPANDVSHWNNNGETFFLIGDSMGDGMVDLLAP
jgi:alpha-galactosidase